MVDEVLLWMNSNWSTAAAALATDRSLTMDTSDPRNVTVGMTSTTSDNVDHFQPLFSEYPDEVLHFAVGACVLFTLIGVPGNFITIVALLRYTKVRNSFVILFVFFFFIFYEKEKKKERETCQKLVIHSVGIGVGTERKRETDLCVWAFLIGSSVLVFCLPVTNLLEKEKGHHRRQPAISPTWSELGCTQAQKIIAYTHKSAV